MKKFNRNSKYAKVLLKIAEKRLKQWEKQVDEAFLIRADIDRKLKWM